MGIKPAPITSYIIDVRVDWRTIVVPLIRPITSRIVSVTTAAAQWCHRWHLVRIRLSCCGASCQLQRRLWLDHLLRRSEGAVSACKPASEATWVNRVKDDTAARKEQTARLAARNRCPNDFFMSSEIDFKCHDSVNFNATTCDSIACFSVW